MGGENRPARDDCGQGVGSSPRGRGKLIPRAGIPGVAGLIPAWAGKTPPRGPTVNLTPAHPRVGGENVIGTFVAGFKTGSSPRGRGKRHARICLGLPAGLIPAWAGKTSRGGANHRGSTAHPRVGGENPGQLGTGIVGAGSSPRGRGKPRLRRPRRGQDGLIPAWAGKTHRRRGRDAHHQAHPRVGGENSAHQQDTARETGSSPRGRGKPERSGHRRPA